MSEFESILLIRDPMYGPASRSIVLKPPPNQCTLSLVIEISELPEYSGDNRLSAGKCTAKFVPTELLELDSYVLGCKSPVLGCLGLVKIDNDIFIGVITESEQIATLSSSPIYRIKKVAFYSLFNSIYDSYNDPPSPTGVDRTFDDWSQPVPQQPVQQLPPHPCTPLIKLFQYGTFYYSHTYDLSQSVQSQCGNNSKTTVTETSDLIDLSDNQDSVNLTVKSPKHTRTASASDFLKTVSNAELPVHQLLMQKDLNYIWNTHILSELLGLLKELELEEQEMILKSGVLGFVVQGFIGQLALENGTLRNAINGSNAGPSYNNGTFRVNTPPRSNSPYTTRSASLPRNNNLPPLPLRPATSPTPTTLTIISRLNYKKAGTRFLARGVDDDGYVSNFVETEMIWEEDAKLFSFVIVRGSVPLFFTQTGIQLSHKITITRSLATSIPALSKHFEMLKERYNSVQVVSLLSLKSDGPEYELGSLFKGGMKGVSGEKAVVSGDEDEGKVGFLEWDFHREVKTGYERVYQDLVPRLSQTISSFGYFCSVDGDPVLFQDGVIRVNCLDCLDRTNFVETSIGKTVLENYLRTIGRINILNDSFWSAVLELWADNGDWLSRIYAGTGALKTAATRKTKATVLGNLSGMLDDAVKSANRFYTNTFLDKSKQQAIDLLLGRLPSSSVVLHNSTHLRVHQELESRKREWTKKRKLNIWCGTWNVNGKKPRDVKEWLWRNGGVNMEKPDIYVIGIQEMIELTPNAVITIDTLKLKEFWSDMILNDLNQIYPNSGAPSYVLLKSSHLVALGFFVYISSNLTSNIREIETQIKKTGMGGNYGNKGGICISFRIFDQRIFLLASHFAAGQDAVQERNKDYETTRSCLDSASQNDVVIWCGDFNYRISVAVPPPSGGVTTTASQIVREMIKQNQVESLLILDQLHIERNARRVFRSFKEAEITFLPTYKYKNDSDLYDELRVPSWTDRIFYKGDGIDLVEYDAILGMRESDHKAVYARFVVDILEVDFEKKEKIKKEVYISSSERQKTTATVVKHRDLPLPSSDNSQWWNDDSAQASGKIKKSPPPPPASKSLASVLK
ncbi:inositol polyphosphate 5-phosphatase [Nowakowskiella sp. JEL0407]|nr:inositol polyphosphate 5-phosphatase [Nowakowskiella sp. JEL0407]